MRKVGVVLAGCGVYDGAEIHEATFTLYSLAKAGVDICCMAPKAPQMHVIDHTNGEPAEDARNVLTESARIARGNIHDMRHVDASTLDAVIFPGGFGVAKNLCDFAVKGADCTVNPDVEALILALHAAGKPLGFACIAPVLPARILGSFAPSLTIGTDPGTAAALEAMGAKHVNTSIEETVICAKNRIVTTPGYMGGESIVGVAKGIDKMVSDVLGLIR